MNSRRIGKYIWAIIGASVLFHVVSLVAGKTLLENWRWPHHPFHTIVESFGALIAFLVAALLLWRNRSRHFAEDVFACNLSFGFRGRSFAIWSMDTLSA